MGFDIHLEDDEEPEAPPVSFPAMVVEAPPSPPPPPPPPPEHHAGRSAEDLADEFERVTMEQERASAATSSDVGKGKKGAAGSGLPPVRASSPLLPSSPMCACACVCVCMRDVKEGTPERTSFGLPARRRNPGGVGRTRAK